MPLYSVSQNLYIIPNMPFPLLHIHSPNSIDSASEIVLKAGPPSLPHRLCLIPAPSPDHCYCPTAPRAASQLFSHQMTHAAWVAKGEKPPDLRVQADGSWGKNKEVSWARARDNSYIGGRGSQQVRPLRGPSRCLLLPGFVHCTAACLHLLPTPREARHFVVRKYHFGSITFWPPISVDSHSPTVTQHTAYSSL